MVVASPVRVGAICLHYTSLWGQHKSSFLLSRIAQPAKEPQSSSASIAVLPARGRRGSDHCTTTESIILPSGLHRSTMRGTIRGPIVHDTGPHRSTMPGCIARAGCIARCRNGCDGQVAVTSHRATMSRTCTNNQKMRDQALRMAHPASSAHLPCHIDQHHNTIDRPNAPGARGELHNHRIHLAGTKMRDDTYRNIHPASSAHLPCHIDHRSSITTTQSIERVELTGRSKRTRSIPFEVGSSHLAKASFGQHTQSNQPNCRKERVHRRRRAR